MPVSEALSAITADVNVMIATGQAPGREQLEILRRNLSAATAEARKVEKDAGAQKLVFRELIDGVEGRIVDLDGLAKRTRKLAGLDA